MAIEYPRSLGFRRIGRLALLSAAAVTLLAATPSPSMAQYQRHYGGNWNGGHWGGGGHWHGGGGAFWPGVALGVGIGALATAPYYYPPAYYAPPPVYYAPPPVYYYPAPVPYGYYPGGGG